MGQVFLLSLTAALNPTLVAASTVMLMLKNPKMSMLGYLLGDLTTSITLGLVIVFALKSQYSQHSISPSVDLALGALALVGAFVVGTGRSTKALHARRSSSVPC